MASAYLNRDRKRLEHEIQNEKYEKLLRGLHEKEPFLRQFMTWIDVLSFMHKSAPGDTRTDEILRPIFEVHAENGDPRWRTILLTIFWPGLESIHFQKRNLDNNPAELWQNVVWTFLKIVCRIDVKQRPDRLVQKVYNDTIHHLYDEYRLVRRRTNHESATDPEEITILAGGAENLGIAAVDLIEAQEKRISRLRAHVEAGRISEEDFVLLVGTRVYGKSLADHAREAGLDYQAAKKRRQRAEAAIFRFEKGDL